MMRRAIISVLVSAFIGGCDRSNQTASPAAPAPASGNTAPAPGGQISYPPTTQPGHILVGDLLGVGITDLQSAGVTVLIPKQVDDDGTISLPLLTKPVMVAGLTDWLADQAIARRYNAERVIENANINVTRLRIAGTGGPPPGPIGEYDLVRIAIWDVEGPSTLSVRVERIGGDGMVTLPYAGQMKIADLTDQQAESAIVKILNDGAFVRNGLVSVLRIEQAPPDAAHLSLPDLPILPVPENLRWLYEPHTGGSPQAAATN
jgi:protein involved in polysaccharide export with SLBB domain